MTGDGGAGLNVGMSAMSPTTALSEAMKGH